MNSFLFFALATVVVVVEGRLGDGIAPLQAKGVVESYPHKTNAICSSGTLIGLSLEDFEFEECHRKYYYSCFSMSFDVVVENEYGVAELLHSKFICSSKHEPIGKEVNISVDAMECAKSAMEDLLEVHSELFVSSDDFIGLDPINVTVYMHHKNLIQTVREEWCLSTKQRFLIAVLPLIISVTLIISLLVTLPENKSGMVRVLKKKLRFE